ncbi:MAG: UDP-3-O-acyl-N-acetylglucosamine deacetylase [Bacteroidales bacterium]|jgi:UDP-3-O-[3-hydroxymyristoyl] N-acetylglucosamine deacetylase/3-hydroxyacyl-[acyl-carrier-protein] dehydratase|nr:UDP-3-O-acyl-N-acetylglucosamine deacetylase [Bacteroidales bacterium]MCI2121352.1 UDP-3-O-acyl-N-acetylglucosamine deacetylase [Bacteroidales bacterium]MCI2145247.1 UDP-3-O-acyl-N-acetylglucosamine deacetylase [Bacteroidales bacterium]
MGRRDRIDPGRQHTVRREYGFEGKGLHTGLFSQILICPAAADSGIVFQRTDLSGGSNMIRAVAENVKLTERSTTLACGPVKVQTAEHLLSALYCLGIDNALIKISGDEAPILDGSAKPYADAISADGLLEQDASRKYIVVDKPLHYKDCNSDSEISIFPSDSFEIDITADYGSKVFGIQKAHYDSGMDYAAEIALCRTFCFLREVEYLLSLDLIKGGDLSNAIVVCDTPVSAGTLAHLEDIFGIKGLARVPEGYLSNVKLHFDNECARHKLLDVTGDFALAGYPLKARIEAYKPGHGINTSAVRYLREQYINSAK